MKRLFGMLLAIVTLAAGSAAADAANGYGGLYGHYGSTGHYGYNHGFYGGGRSYRTSYYGGLPGVYYGSQGRHHHHWHDTSHYDYHPSEFVPHNGHWDYMPGHYDWHHEGHWDHH